MNLKKIAGGILLSSLLFIISCTKSDETKPGTDDADKFVGSWICTEKVFDPKTSSYVASGTFTINISKASASSISIANFNNTKETVTAQVSGSVLTILSQTKNGITFDGNGSLSGGTLSMSY